MASKQLLQTIDNELRWREAELAIAKIHLHRSLIERSSFKFSYRSFVVLTYAHFEAFTKLILAQAMNDIFSSGVAWSDCSRSIQVNLFASRLRSSLSGMSNSAIVERGSSSVCIIDELTAPSLDVMLQCANMDVPNFSWAVECIGLDPARYSESRRDIGRLTSMRHECAHGEALTFDQTKTERELADDLFVLQSRMILLMHSLAVDVIDHITARGFRRV
jgi:hypothetical protein